MNPPKPLTPREELYVYLSTPTWTHKNKAIISFKPHNFSHTVCENIMSEDSRGTIISVGAGKNQKDFITSIKRRGYKVCAFGKGQNDESAIKICDFFCEIDTSNHKEALAWIDSLNEKIIGAGSFSGGTAIDTLQKIERAYELPTKIPVNLSVGMDKIEQQDLYQKLNIGSIHTFLLNDVKKDIIDDTCEYIIKPAIGRGSADVQKITGKEVKNLLSELDINNKTIIQEYLHGEEFRVFLLIQNGHIKMLSPIKRYSKNGSYLLGRLEYCADKEKPLRIFFEDLIKRTNIKSCVIKADLIISKTGKLKLIEMDIGVGGGKYFKNFINILTDTDTTELYIDLISGKEIPKIIGKPTKFELMDYCYIEKNRYNLKKNIVNDFFKNLLGDCLLQYNSMLENVFLSKEEVNSDFIVAVIHHRRDISNQEINIAFKRFMNINLAA